MNWVVIYPEIRLGTDNRATSIADVRNGDRGKTGVASTNAIRCKPYITSIDDLIGGE
jgi:hypothetical protein